MSQPEFLIGIQRGTTGGNRLAVTIVSKQTE